MTEGRSHLANEADKLRLFEETAKVSTETIVSGRVRITTATDVIADSVRQDLEGTRVEITRVPIDRYVETGTVAPQPRTEGDVTIIPILEEVVIVEKRLLLKEEIHLRQHRTTVSVDVSTEVKKQRAIIERTDEKGHFISGHQSDLEE